MKKKHIQGKKPRKLIILDRDGVINYESPAYIKTPDEWIPIPGSLEAIAALSQAGYTVVVATNQSGVGRHYYSLDMLKRIHEKMQKELAALNGRIDHIYVCPHHPEAGCDCRKPKPGLFLKIAEDYPQLFPKAIFVGDSLSDIKVAQAVGCQPILVKTGHGMNTLAQISDSDKIPVFENLSDFVESLSHKKKPSEEGFGEKRF